MPIRTVIARAEVERDENGRPVRLPGVVVDVTDRVLAEHARSVLATTLNEQSRTVETLLSSIADFAYTFDRDGRFVYANKALLDLWGLRLEDAVGRNFFDLQYPYDLAAKLQQQIKQVFDTRQPLSDGTAYTSPTGAGGYYEYIFTPIVDVDGSVPLVAGTTRNVTEQNHVLEALRESESRFRQLADAMPQIVWAAQADGTLDYYNRRWYEYVDLPPDAGDQARWDRYIHPDDLQRAYETWALALSTGMPYGVEFRVRRSAGEYRWFLVRALPIRDAQHRVTRWFGTCTDIEDQRRLLAQNEYLLQSERAARSVAEHASLMKDEFLATLSHELRTPLSAILGWSQVMRMRPMSGPDLQRGLEAIERNARAQTQLIEDLLDMSRVISGKLRLDIKPLQPGALVEAALETVLPAAVAKNITIDRDLQPGIELLHGDQDRLQQVLWNLLSNAIKFTPAGGNVRIALRSVNSSIRISIADTGQGIAADFLPHVFDRFRQADSSTTRKHSGLGLGLAIVKELVALHGGTVRVESAGENRGCVFTVELPLSPPQPQPVAEAPPPGMPTDSPARHGFADLAGLTILVVEDDADGRELIKRVLDECGARVLTAASAAEGLASIKADAPDLLVSDIGMAAMDGYEFLKLVRAADPSNGAAIPAIALSAFVRPEDKARALAAGYAAHVSKPADPSQLVATIATVAGRRAAGFP